MPPLRIEAVGDPARGPRFLGYVGDLSSTGVFVQSSNPRDPGTRLKIKVHLRGRRQRPFYAEVEVRWRRGYGGLPGPPSGMGLEFVDLGRRERRELSRLLQSESVTLRHAARRGLD